jgi:acid phosphatase
MIDSSDRVHVRTVKFALGVIVAFGITIAGAVPKAAAPTAHVLLVMLENKGYQKTLGACSADPYFCSLAKSYASITGYVGIGHPSLPNYLEVTAGTNEGCTSDSCATGRWQGDLMQQLIANSIPFVLYMESMPSPCFKSKASQYVVSHNPGPYFTDDNCSTTDVAYPGASGLVTALSNYDFVWISPNQQDNMHSGTVQKGDAWLKANLPGVLTSSWFTGGNATVIVTMDENDNGGTPANQIPMVVISSNAAGKGNLALGGSHFTTLGAIETVFGLPLLGRATREASLTALFG